MADQDHAATELRGPFTLDAAHLSFAGRIPPQVDAARTRYLEVDVTEVSNPGKVRVTFAVQEAGTGGAKVLLGTFALFPPDNPGRFLIGTRDKLKQGGSIVVEMRVLDPVGPESELRVTIGRIAFREK